MKAITLWQPYATLVARGLKTMETRSWDTKYRGPLAIHAASRPPVRDATLWSAISEVTPVFGVWDEFFMRGCVVAVVDVMEVYRYPDADLDHLLGGLPREMVFGDFGPGRFAWRLDNVRRCNPVQARGYQRIWNLDLPDLDFV